MKRYTILVLMLSLMFTGCNSWLDVSPEDQIGEKDLFSTGEGFRNALNGVYKSMAESDFYGRNMTWGIVDAMGQMYGPWDRSTSEVSGWQYGASKYAWNHVKLKPEIETIWSKAYNLVANCNNILNNIEHTAPGKFAEKERERNVIWGEALALRAFIQFDMLRLFAPSPKMNPQRAYIPYVAEYPSFVSPKKTVGECLDLMIADLEKAKDLVWTFDSTVTMNLKNRFEEKGIGEKRFLMGRGYRLNYYAIQAMLARVYMYAGKKAEALKYAENLIKYQKEKNCFVFKDQSVYGDLKNYSDVLFGLYAPKLPEWDKRINSWSNPEKLSWLEIYNVNVFFNPGLDMVYDKNGSHLESYDYRFKNSLYDYNYEGKEFALRKNQEQTTSGTKCEVANTLVPLVRMSEMYYIAAEIKGEQSELKEGVSYLCDVKIGRGFPADDYIITDLKKGIVDFEGLMYEMLNDARREFIGEGQIFYMYKRLARSLKGIEGNVFPTEENYVIPLPENETNF